MCTDLGRFDLARHYQPIPLALASSKAATTEMFGSNVSSRKKTKKEKDDGKRASNHCSNLEEEQIAMDFRFSNQAEDQRTTLSIGIEKRVSHHESLEDMFDDQVALCILAWIGETCPGNKS